MAIFLASHPNHINQIKIPILIIIDYFHFPTREGAINLEKLRLPAKTRAIEKFQSRVSLWTYVGDLEA